MANKLFVLLLSFLFLLAPAIEAELVEPHIKQYFKVAEFAGTGVSSVVDMQKYPSSNYSVQITADGTVTAFEVDVETTLNCDDSDTYTPIVALNLVDTADSLNDIKSAVGYMARCVRINVSTLTLGTATGITVYLLILRDH